MQATWRPALANVSYSSQYCLDPVLLIVMEFVNGGTLADFVDTQDPLDPPTFTILLKILVGSAKGFVSLDDRSNRDDPISRENNWNSNSQLDLGISPRKRADAYFAS